MKLYSAVIHLAGEMKNQVRKNELTAAEIVLLRVIHGNDAVHEIEHVANVNRSDARERQRLAGIYSLNRQDGFKSGEALVLENLGIAGTPLPDDVPEPENLTEPEAAFEVEAEDEEIIEPVGAKPIQRTRIERPRRNAEAELTA